jgi:thiosulfate/3-mercaptopyruvate sulfurtransferase
MEHIRSESPAAARAVAAAALSVFLLAAPNAGHAQMPAAAAAAANQTLPVGGVIVGAEQALALQKVGAKIVDVRPKSDFDKGHIPGAVNLPWTSLQRSETDGLRNQLAADSDLAKAFGAAGLSYDDTIVLADVNVSGGRAYVPFAYAGFAKLHVLDGGLANWKGQLATASPAPAATRFTLSRRQSFSVDQAYVAGKVGAADEFIVDARNEEAFSDGHIPGARVIPAEFYVEKNGTLRPRDVLLRELAAKGLTQTSRIVSYCGSGGAASNAYLFLKDLGFQNVVFYDGSWDEWSRDPKSVQQVSLPNYTLASLTNNSGGGARILDEAAVKELQKRPDVVVLDVRSTSDFGAGRIPNSVNVFWNDTLTADREIKPRAELEALYKAKGVTPDKHVIVFTRGGLQATHSFTVLKLLGYEKVDVFVGQWEGWLNRAFQVN